MGDTLEEGKTGGQRRPSMGGPENWVQRRVGGRGQGACRNPYLLGVELAMLQVAFHGTQVYRACALWGRSQLLFPLAASLLKALPPTSATAAE